jgi:isoprenylcysteine carboxyl methyltransferase (ICMT) family protein YpbQ
MKTLIFRIQILSNFVSKDQIHVYTVIYANNLIRHPDYVVTVIIEMHAVG